MTFTVNLLYDPMYSHIYMTHCITRETSFSGGGEWAKGKLKKSLLRFPGIVTRQIHV